MNSLDALRRMVDHYPGGRAAVALRLNKTDEVLRKELSGAPSHKMGLVDAAAISDMCCEARSEHAEALATSLACSTGQLIALPVREMVTTQCLRSDAASLLKETSDVLQEVTAALVDDEISDNERSRIEREIGELAGKLQQLHRGVRANNEAVRARHLRAEA